MHVEIEAILNDLDPGHAVLNTVMLKNAEKLLSYIEDINLERTGKLELTAAESLYLLWEVEGWELHLECLTNGNILYTFGEGWSGKVFGSCGIDEFMLILENCLLTDICG